MKTSPEDKIFSLFIRCRDRWTCTRCKVKYEDRSRGMHCSHYFGRGKIVTRFDEDNADAHCCGCHRYLESNPHEFYNWKTKQMGKKKYNELCYRWAQKGKNMTKEEKKIFKSKYKDKIIQLGYSHVL